MAVAKWSAFGTESANIANTALNSRATGTTNFVADIDNTTDRDLYAAFWVNFGSMTPSAGGSATLSLRRKRGSTYAENPSDSFTAVTTGSGARAFPLEFPLRLPGPGTYGLYFTNNLGANTNASGNELYQQDWNEEVS
jgi:hypothetical protein